MSIYINEWIGNWNLESQSFYRAFNYPYRCSCDAFDAMEGICMQMHLWPIYVSFVIIEIDLFRMLNFATFDKCSVLNDKMYCTLYTVHRTPYTVHYTPYTIYRTISKIGQRIKTMTPMYHLVKCCLPYNLHDNRTIFDTCTSSN